MADYNQIELRCIAHLAEDPGLIAAFESGTDIHTETASRIFGADPAKVTTEQRSKAKMVSYGLAYGMEAYGLGQRLSISTPEAQDILDAYFVAFPAVRAYMERTVAEARERGYGDPRPPPRWRPDTTDHDAPDQPGSLQPAQRRVDRAGRQVQPPAGAVAQGLDHGVAVTRAVFEGGQQQGVQVALQLLCPHR